jgi:hypothetical protein
MRFSLVLAGIALPIVTLAVPTTHSRYSRLPGSLFVRQDNTSCNLAGTPQPANALTPPTPDLSLVLIAQGVGTQNYSCAAANSTPTAIGAVASLFNISCAVAEGTLGSINEDAAAIGAHFFVDATTPEFDIIGLGNTLAKKVENVTAPTAGNVPWLRLEAQAEGTTSAVRQIYRLNTEGGVAPSTCADAAAGETVTVQYKAEYWIYACTKTMKKLREKHRLTV